MSINAIMQLNLFIKFIGLAFAVSLMLIRSRLVYEALQISSVRNITNSWHMVNSVLGDDWNLEGLL